MFFLSLDDPNIAVPSHTSLFSPVNASVGLCRILYEGRPHPSNCSFVSSYGGFLSHVCINMNG